MITNFYKTLAIFIIAFAFCSESSYSQDEETRKFIESLSTPAPGSDTTFIPLTFQNSKKLADKESPWMFFIYESLPFRHKAGKKSVLFPQAFHLKNWDIMWFVEDERGESYYVAKQPQVHLDHPGTYKLYCYLRYVGEMQETKRVTWKNDASISYNMQFCQLSESQLNAVRPEVLLVPAVGFEVDFLPAKRGAWNQFWQPSQPKRFHNGTQSDAYQPNVLMLMVDTLRPDHTIPGGHSYVLAPHINMISSLGVTFQNAYGASSSTRPSVGSIFTGLQPKAHGAVRHALDGAGLFAGIPTLAEQFQQQGYQTVGVSSNAQVTDNFGFDRGFDTYECPVWENQVTPKGLNWLQQLDEPFFLYLHYLAPHAPYEPPQDLAEIYQGKTQYEEQDNYLAEITLDDRRVGLILKELALQGMLENTIVYFVSDHGEEFWEHGWNGHGAKLYEETVLTSSIWMYPKQLPMGKAINTKTMHVDVMPTLAELLNWEPPEISQGKSLMEFFLNEDFDQTQNKEQIQEQFDWKNRPIFLHHGGGTAASAHESDKDGVILHDHKLIWWNQKDEWELYNLGVDPLEQNNIINGTGLDISQMKELLKKHVEASHLLAEQFILPGSGSVFQNLDARELENMRALGYID